MVLATVSPKFALFLGHRRPQILDFHQPLAHKDHESDARSLTHGGSAAGSERNGLTARTPSRSWSASWFSVRRYHHEADLAAATVSVSQKDS